MRCQLQNEDDLKIVDDLKNEDDLENEDNLMATFKLKLKRWIRQNIEPD